MEETQNSSVMKLIWALVGATVIFWLVSFVLPSLFTSGGGDWSDSVYADNPELLLTDQIRAGYVAGFLAALYLAAQANFVFWLTRKQSLVHRMLLLGGVLVISFVIAVSFGVSQMSEYRLGA